MLLGLAQRHLRSIRWQYPVPLELLLRTPPRPDLAGKTAQGADLSSVQVRCREHYSGALRWSTPALESRVLLLKTADNSSAANA